MLIVRTSHDKSGEEMLSDLEEAIEAVTPEADKLKLMVA